MIKYSLLFAICVLLSAAGLVFFSIWAVRNLPKAPPKDLFSMKLARNEDLLAELAQVRRTLDSTFSNMHSFRFLLRSAAKGVDYLRYSQELTTLQERVSQLGAGLLEGSGRLSDGADRLIQFYWCYLYISASTLADLAQRSDREFREGKRFNDRDRQVLLRRYLQAIKEARILGKQLDPKGV